MLTAPSTTWKHMRKHRLSNILPGVLLAGLLMVPGACTIKRPIWFCGFGEYTVEDALEEHGRATSIEIKEDGTRVITWNKISESHTKWPIQDPETGEITGARDLAIETRRHLRLTFDRSGRLRARSWKTHVEIR